MTSPKTSSGPDASTSVFNDRLGDIAEVDDEAADYYENKLSSGIEDLIKHRRPHPTYDDVIQPGRPEKVPQGHGHVHTHVHGHKEENGHGHEYVNDHKHGHNGNKFSLEDLIANGRPPTILLGNEEDDNENAEPETTGDHDHTHYGFHSYEHVPVENGRPPLYEDLEDSAEDSPVPEDHSYDSDYLDTLLPTKATSIDTHDFHSYHTLQLLYNKNKKNESATMPDESSEKDKIKLPGYFPQLATSHLDNHDSELSALKPNFTQTLQSSLVTMYPHNVYHNYEENKYYKTTTKRPPYFHKRLNRTSTPAPTRPHSHIPTDSASIYHHKETELTESNLTDPIDRFSADILDPNPNFNKLLTKNNPMYSSNHPKYEQPVKQENKTDNVVSIDEWKAILIEKLTSAISKVAESQGTTTPAANEYNHNKPVYHEPNHNKPLYHESNNNKPVKYGLSHDKPVYAGSTHHKPVNTGSIRSKPIYAGLNNLKNKQLPDLGIIDDNEYVHRHQELPEKNTSSLVVNVWDYNGGNLEKVGQKKIPSALISSGNPDRLGKSSLIKFNSLQIMKQSRWKKLFFQYCFFS